MITRFCLTLVLLLGMAAPMVLRGQNAPAKEFHFLIDNAAGGSVMLPGIAKELGLELRDLDNQVSGTGGDAGRVKTAIANNVVIGGLLKRSRHDYQSHPHRFTQCTHSQ